ncbi:MAG: hypothetical protein WCO00_16800 [Rhodospirillaceae bacterium]
MAGALQVTLSWRRIGSALGHAVHECRLAEHGGADGVRDAEALAANGTPDGARPAAAGTLEERDLAAWFRQRLTGQRRPAAVDFVPRGRL